MEYQALKRASELKRRGLVKVGETTMTREEAAQRSGPARGQGKSMHDAAASTFSGHEIQVAEARGRAAERQRWETVMLSHTARGRERTAAAMLATENDNAETIRAKLAALPTSAEREERASIDRATRAAAVWDKAIAANYGMGDSA